MTVKITPDLLADLRQKAENCQPPIWKLDEHSDVISDAHTVAECGFAEDAQHIATADPATVLALVEEIERLRAELKPNCPHWQQDGDGINEWRRCCTNNSYYTPAGGEPSGFCPDCGGKVEVLAYDPKAESEAGR